jgi:dihydrofolate reductase
MGKLTVTEFVTLDGVGQAPGGPDEDPESDFPHGGWQAPLLNEDAGAAMFEQAKDMDALLLGRKTFDIFADYWPTAPDEMPFTALLNRVPKYVASRTLTEPLRWADSSVVGEPLVEQVGELKHRHDAVHVIGSLHLLQSLVSARLVDRLNLWLHPVVLGTGKRVFAEGTVPSAAQLVHSVTYPSGSIQLEYDLAGIPTYGTIGV